MSGGSVCIAIETTYNIFCRKIMNCQYLFPNRKFCLGVVFIKQEPVIVNPQFERKIFSVVLS